MENNLEKICNGRWRCSVVYLLGLNLVRAAVQIYLFQRGFISVSADEFARGILAAKWAQAPTIDLLADIQGTWLPFEKYLNGLFLLVWPNEIITPRVTVFIASCILVFLIYYLTNYLFASQTAAVASTLFISFQPWFVWMSGTPMLEMYYFALFFAGLLFLLMWLKEQCRSYWFWAGLCFLLSSGFHVQSWTLINLVNLLTLPILFIFLRQRDWTNVLKLIGFYVLSNGLILAFSLFEFLYTGEMFAFLAKHSSYSKWYYDGYNVPVRDKFLYYPRLVWHNANTAVWVGLVIGLVFLARAKERHWAISPLLLALAGLLLNSVMNIFSGPPSAAPDRYSLFHIIIFSLYVGYGFARLITFTAVSWPKLTQYAVRLVAALVLAYGLWWGVERIPNYPQGMSRDTVDVGETVDALLTTNPGVFMVELRYWDYLSVELASNHFDDVVYDRLRDIRNRDLPSIFAQDEAKLCQDLAVYPDLRYVLLLDEVSKARAEEIAYLANVQEVGRWTIYQVIPEQSPAMAGCN
ncbi:MAG: hypothetical protein IPM53_09515 [Anaerolineaceae bacterium]|nr:hypothetical protein [Anaerolineaceae bacterium]